MKHTTSQTTPSHHTSQTPPAQPTVGQTDTKEILLLGAGLLTLALGLGGVLMYSEDTPPPTRASKATEEVSTFQMTKAFARPSSPSPTLITSEPRPALAIEPSLHLVSTPFTHPQPEDTNVYFAFNQWTLSDEAKDLIKTQVQGRPEGWTGLLRIEGHTDAQGSATYNQALGLRRAEAVKTYLVSLGIPETTIQVQSLGKDGAVCQETTPDCLELNRRAHVAFLPQSMDQEEATLLSRTPDDLNLSTQEYSSPLMVQQDTEESEEAIPAQEDLPAELVAIEPLVTVESIP